MCTWKYVFCIFVFIDFVGFDITGSAFFFVTVILLGLHKKVLIVASDRSLKVKLSLNNFGDRK